MSEIEEAHALARKFMAYWERRTYAWSNREENRKHLLAVGRYVLEQEDSAKVACVLMRAVDTIESLNVRSRAARDFKRELRDFIAARFERREQRPVSELEPGDIVLTIWRVEDGWGPKSSMIYVSPIGEDGDRIFGYEHGWIHGRWPVKDGTVWVCLD